MSTNIDVQNQNTDIQIGDGPQISSPLKDSINEADAGAETRKTANTQNMETPSSSPCDSDNQSSKQTTEAVTQNNENQTDSTKDSNSNTADNDSGKQSNMTEASSNDEVISNVQSTDTEKPSENLDNVQTENDTDTKPEEDSSVTNEPTSESASVISSHSTKDISDQTQFSSDTGSAPAMMLTSESSDKNTPPETLLPGGESKAITPSTQSEITDSSQSSPLEIPDDDFLGAMDQDKPSCSEGGATSATAADAAGASDHTGFCPSSTYHIKWMKFREESCPIITQNENGPCPLIAIMNVLLLQRKVKFPPMMEMVTSSQLMDYLGDCILEYAPTNISEDALLNYEQNMHDAMAVFHKLQTGLDVNVKFTGVSTFEYTSECIVFDLLGIPLYHGWLVDPENMTEVSAVGNNSYNQLVEKIISQKNSVQEEKVREALIAEDFLNRSSHQLTYHGLSELATTVKEDNLCVFFRNNHFSTLYKHRNELFLLVTDQGFLTEASVVWETLSNVEGDGHFVNAFFQTYRKPEPSTHTIPPASVPEGSAQQIDQDFLVALSLQQEQQQQQPPPPAIVPAPEPTWEPHLSDHELALKLQEEENHRAAVAIQRQQQQQQQQQQQSPGGASGAWAVNNGASGRSQSRPARTDSKRDKKDSNDCQIL